MWQLSDNECMHLGLKGEDKVWNKVTVTWHVTVEGDSSRIGE